MDFLEVTIRRNPNLIRTAVELHQSGEISANTVVIDLDAVKKNAQFIRSEAEKYRISNYFMTKQHGRNPLVNKVIADLGLKAVAVDMEDVRCVHKYGIPIGHVGHLSQIPKNDIEYVLKEIKPEVITVFTIEKARQISSIARKLRINQKLLVRPIAKGDFFYPNQDGGFPEEHVLEAVKTINSFPNVKVVGVTSFPCLRFNLLTRREETLPNFDTLLRVASRLEKDLGLEIEQINTPADTSSKVMKILAEKGSTHGEPGHGFTGTTPWHAFEDLPEIPAWVYVSEVSHLLGNTAFVFGGNFMSADMCIGIWTYQYNHFRVLTLVGSNPETVMENRILGQIVPGYFDYYVPIYPREEDKVEVGDTVVYGVRNQVFASRTKVAVVSGIQNKRAKMLGIFDRTGNMLGKDDIPLNKAFARKFGSTLLKE